MKISRGESIDRYYLFKLFGFGLFLHHIHDDDPKRIFHSHPWNGITLILGSYREEHADNPGVIRTRWGFGWVSAKRHHRVEVDHPTYSIFFHFRKSNMWSIINLDNDTETDKPWEGEQGYKDYSKF